MDAEVRQHSLDQLTIDNPLLAALPGDHGPNQPRQTPGACYSHVDTRRAPSPSLVAVSDEVMALLELDPAAANTPAFLEVFAGNRLLDGMAPHAACYGGHQFGHWAGQLGDGRATNLGEVVTGDGARYMLQLKGAGPTPYSRMADGLAVLRSSVREFLCSEAMHHLGVPTTRALSLVATGESVTRDMFYDGHPRDEPGAVVCRVARSFLRFGNFEIHAARGEDDLLRDLADFAIDGAFPALAGSTGPTRYQAWFEEICRRTADLLVEWMRVGFVHGVMNTDNMSILGLTIDYGPYGWLEDYDPRWTPNTTDAGGRRYCFGNQPRIASWNLARFGSALVGLVGDAEGLQQALNQDYAERFQRRWQEMMAAKLGLQAFRAGDEALVEGVLDLLGAVETDMTLFFRQLGHWREDADPRALFAPAWYREEQVDGDYLGRLEAFLADYRARLSGDGDADARSARMQRVNPKYVLRNYLAQLAIDAAEAGNYDEVNTLLDVMRRPYDEQPGRERYAERRPEWARERAGCSMLSCSS